MQASQLLAASMTQSGISPSETPDFKGLGLSSPKVQGQDQVEAGAPTEGKAVVAQLAGLDVGAGSPTNASKNLLKSRQSPTAVTAGASALTHGSSEDLANMFQAAPTGVQNQKAISAAERPWKGDWVFKGDELESSTLKPLFGAQTDASKVGLHPEAKVGAQAPTLAPGEQTALAEMLAKLGVSLDDVDGEQIGEREAPSQGQRNNLSGSMFLETLNGVKAAGQGSERNNFSQEQGQGGSDPSNGQKTLRLIEGGGKEESSLQAPGEKLRGATKGKNTPFGKDPTGYDSFVVPHNPGPNAKELAASAGPPELTGLVTRGSMTKERLSTESVNNFTNGIKSLAAQGGGEMKIRLNPDSLGELQVKIKTVGSDVGIQFHASTEAAKRVIEESISHLKENLAAQSLNLTRVETSVSAMAASSEQSKSDLGQSAFQQAGGQNLQDWSGSQRGGRDASQGESGRQSPWENSNDGVSTLRPAATRQRAASGGSSRLDVMA